MDNRIVKVCAATLSLAAVCTGVAVGLPADQQPQTVAGLLRFENMRVQAEAAYDAAALSQDVSDDLKLVHGGGDSITKAQYLDMIKQEGPAHFVTSIDLSDVTGKVIGDVGITDGIMTNHLKNHLDHVSRYLGVYTYGDGHWTLIRWQTTNISRPGH